MRVKGREIGRGEPCFVVAEAGLAHNGEMELAFELIDAAARGGADAVKFQVYRTDELIDRRRDPEMFKRFRRKELPYSAFAELKEYAERNRLIWFATPHTKSAFDLLRSFGGLVYKIGSGEKGSSLFGKILDTGKPVIVSLGMREQSEALREVELYGGENVAFLHCITAYPAVRESLNLGFLRKLERACNLVGSVFGYSCHSPGSIPCEVAVAMGAKIIEKHIKVEESEGQDTDGALFAGEFAAMTKKIKVIETILGSETRIYGDKEKEAEKWALKGEDGKRPL